MKPKTLRFVEQFLDEDPPTGPDEPRYWRGISAYVGEVCVFRVTYDRKRNIFDDFDTTLSSPGTAFRRKVYNKAARTKEEVKLFTQEMFNEYVKSLCDED